MEPSKGGVALRFPPHSKGGAPSSPDCSLVARAGY